MALLGAPRGYTEGNFLFVSHGWQTLTFSSSMVPPLLRVLVIYITIHMAASQLTVLLCTQPHFLHKYIWMFCSTTSFHGDQISNIRQFRVFIVLHSAKCWLFTGGLPFSIAIAWDIQREIQPSLVSYLSFYMKHPVWRQASQVKWREADWTW